MRIDANGSPADVRLLQNVFKQVFKETIPTDLPGSQS